MSVRCAYLASRPLAPGLEGSTTEGCHLRCSQDQAVTDPPSHEIIQVHFDKESNSSNARCSFQCGAGFAILEQTQIAFVQAPTLTPSQWKQLTEGDLQRGNGMQCMHADHENMLLRKSLTCVGPLQAAPMQNLVLPASLARNAACSDSRQSMRFAKGGNKGKVCVIAQHNWQPKNSPETVLGSHVLAAEQRPHHSRCEGL